jgi:hypothetical protein
LPDPADQVVFLLSTEMVHLLAGAADDEAIAAQAKPGF